MSCTPKSAEEAKTGKAMAVKEANGIEYSLITEKSEIRWRGTKPAGEHYGTVDLKEGLLVLENDQISGGSFTIDLNTIVNEDLEGDMNSRLVGHLKSEDFFFTENYPEAIFEIVSVKDISDDASDEEITTTHEITGNLTMRGKTNSISFPAMIQAEDDRIKVKTNEFSIDRTKWGVNFKSKTVFAEFKDDFISDMMNIKLEVEFVVSES